MQQIGHEIFEIGSGVELSGQTVASNFQFGRFAAPALAIPNLDDLPVIINQERGDGYLFQRRIVASLIARGWLGLGDLDGFNVGPVIDRFLGITDYVPFFIRPEIVIHETDLANHRREGNKFCGEVIIEPASTGNGPVLDVEDYFISIGPKGTEAFLRVLDCSSDLRIWSSAELFSFATMNWWGGEDTDDGALNYMVEDCGEAEAELDPNRSPSIVRERLQLPDSPKPYGELAHEALANWLPVNENEAALHGKLTSLLENFLKEQQRGVNRFVPEFIEEDECEREPLLVLNFANNLGRQLYDDLEHFANSGCGSTSVIAAFNFNGAMEFATALQFMREYVFEIRLVDDCLRALRDCQKQPLASLPA